jgi:hypothetical protein
MPGQYSILASASGRPPAWTSLSASQRKNARIPIGLDITSSEFRTPSSDLRIRMPADGGHSCGADESSRCRVSIQSWRRHRDDLLRGRLSPHPKAKMPESQSGWTQQALSSELRAQTSEFECPPMAGIRAGRTRVELATSCVTGRRSNQTELPPPQKPLTSTTFRLLRRSTWNIFTRSFQQIC